VEGKLPGGATKASSQMWGDKDVVDNRLIMMEALRALIQF
jgi:hypothetical protein